jgi:hypothetical protein
VIKILTPSHQIAFSKTLHPAAKPDRRFEAFRNRQSATNQAAAKFHRFAAF